MNYCELLFTKDEKYLDNEALIDSESGRRATYKVLQNEVKRYAVILKKLGYKNGDVISVHLYNSIEVAVILLAIQYIGGVISLIDPLFKPDELDYYIKDSHSKFLITHLDKIDLKDKLDSNVKILNIVEFDNLYLTATETIEDYYDYKEDELAMLLYTSGSTSTPKGVMLSTKCFFIFLEKSKSSMYRYKHSDRLLCFVPFSHAYGSVSLLVPALYGNATIVFMRAFQPTKIANIIRTENITHLFGVPTHYQQLLRYESIYDMLKNLKAAFSAAAPLSFETASKWKDITGIYLDEGYGMTETTTLIATRLNMLPEPAGNVGYPPEGIIEIQAIDKNKNLCDDGIIGELRIRGKGFMLGYINKEEATNEIIRDGWLYTGDYGYKRSDGSYVICGRKTEFINVAGLKISPIEIEAALNSHKDVIDSAAVGIEDVIYSEVVKAYVVLKDGVKIRERELIKYLTGKIANFKVPKSITFIDKLPRNNIGKIDKKALKKIN